MQQQKLQSLPYNCKALCRVVEYFRVNNVVFDQDTKLSYIQKTLYLLQNYLQWIP